MSKKDYKLLSKKYRQGRPTPLSRKEVDSYLIARMPATFAALKKVLQEVSKSISLELEIKSLLDLGAGPGTGLLAAKEVFSHIDRAILIERNEHMIAHAKVEAEWIQGDFSSMPLPHSDLVLLSYSFGELPVKTQKKVLKKAWEVAQVFVIVEPGTPKGFSHILQARDQLIEWGGHIIAPCPHTRECPMAGSDWCHFAIRLERNREHKHAKEGTLGWEDEKYSYIAMGKKEAKPTQGRIVRHPRKNPGHVLLQLCAQDGLIEKTISRKQKELYKKARKAKWGDGLSLGPVK